MAGKLQHGRGKHPARSKKAKAKQRTAVMASSGQSVVARMPEPAVLSHVSAPPASRRILPTTSRAPRYPYITAELKRIGIVAGIILAILVVLALVLS